MKKNEFKPTTDFLESLPRTFWEEQYRFSAMCIKIGKEKRSSYSDLALVTGDWSQTNKAHQFVNFWENKFQEAKEHLRQMGMIA